MHVREIVIVLVKNDGLTASALGGQDGVTGFTPRHG